jgi:uncharacterized membrane protein
VTRWNEAAQPEEERQAMSVIIAWVLVLGVGLSALVMAFGLLLLITTGETGYHQTLSLDLVLGHDGQVAYPTTVSDVWAGAVALKPFAVIELGVLLLIATPVFRVAASIVLFLLEQDYLYTAITAAVLAVLLVSIFWLR